MLVSAAGRECVADRTAQDATEKRRVPSSAIKNVSPPLVRWLPDVSLAVIVNDADVPEGYNDTK